ncbi:stage III sporulation protein SpoIIIAB [Bacillus sp. FJAT-44742]|uniref:stage III sporulation protein SpoIIIAB n=1 Tax=Bacillus sp. FJAT-44742 TaxID=2014005 RepID=UPI000C23FE74|nr:stage III sporulation protein SpoIIIAB [Bacillus sp. FJAT-44742]
MKWLGAILILSACTWAGFAFARRLSDRPRQLRMLVSALQSFEAEMMYGLTPLMEASLKLSRQIPKPISYMFAQFAYYLQKGEESAEKAWDACLADTWPLTALQQNELEVMKQFGATLGQHDRIQQQKQIRLALSHLAREEQDAKESQKRFESMAKSLGFLTGMLVIVLMI